MEYFKKFGVSVSELKEANNLSSNLLSIGQNLIIPGKVPEKKVMNMLFKRRYFI